MSIYLVSQMSVRLKVLVLSTAKAFSQRTDQVLPGSWLYLILDMFHVCFDTIIHLFFQI